MRPCISLVALTLLIAACGGSAASTTSPDPTFTPAHSPALSPQTLSAASPSPITDSPAPPSTPAGTIVPAIPETAPPSPTPVPTVSPTPIPIHHGPPYTIAIEAGHGGAYYWGASALDPDNSRLWIEKDINLAVAQKVSELLTQAGYNTIMIRSDDSTLTPWDPNNYRASLIREAQARVDVANAGQADVYLAIHFNGWVDNTQKGTETYCNPDRSFGQENCELASLVQQAVVQHIRDAGYDDVDRGVKNDADVGGDPNNPHSFALGTDDNFSPTLMPGIISESLFLTNPDDLGFLHRPDAYDVIAAGLADGVNAYFQWLNGG